jgi:hypothetical protein
LSFNVNFLYLPAAMADEELLDKVQDLSDLELAALLCLTAQEHCIIDTEPDALGDLVLELQLVSGSVFLIDSSMLKIFR